jgi:hypothetical protein
MERHDITLKGDTSPDCDCRYLASDPCQYTRDTLAITALG